MLKTDTIDGTLHIEIHPRKTWRLIFDFLVVAFWGAFFYASLLGFSNRANIGRSTAQGLGVVIFTLTVFLWMVYLALKALFYYEGITITPQDILIQGRLLSISISNRQYGNSSVSNLRYEEWSGGRGGTQNGIRFECNTQTVTFARQADTSDSWDLIDRVRAVYPFQIPAPTPSPAVTQW